MTTDGSDPDALLARLVDDYQSLAPQYRPLLQALRERGDSVVNDHIALRTIAHPGLGIEAVAAPFLAAGWTLASDRYRFAAKHLDARYLRPPRSDLPRVFISELRLDELSAASAGGLRELVAGVAAPDLPGRPWSPSAAACAALRAESEYAGWFAACGWRVNHVTIAVHSLRGFADFAAFVDWVRELGLPVNERGGAIKGSPAVGLEQASTMAPSVIIELADGPAELPGCYVEFAWRHPGADGAVYDGFIPESADRIFESTDVDPGGERGR